MNILTNPLEIFKGKKEQVKDIYEVELSLYLNGMALSSMKDIRLEYLKDIIFILNSKYGMNLHISKTNEEQNDARMLQVLRKLKEYGN